MTTTMTLAELKTRQQATWGSGDYGKIAWLTAPLADTLCEAVDLRPGATVLDVATGTGHVALAAARRFCTVTGVDYVPALVETARVRAASEDLSVTFEEGDAEALRFKDGSFDYVLSAIGVMFTADHEKAAGELVRVCRSGGTIGLVNWTPSGFVGEMFRTIGAHVPPPPEAKPPGLWGTQEYLVQLLGEVDLRIETGEIAMRFLSAEHFAQFFIENYGPTLKAHASLDNEQRRALSVDLRDLALRRQRDVGDVAVCPFEYIVAVGRKL